MSGMGDFITGGMGFGKILSSLTAKAATQSAPILKEPTVMPTADDAAIRAAKRKALAGQSKRSGRQSTILSGDGGVGSSDTLG